jgi:VanZ family protein
MNRTAIRVIWILYALALFAATHWPGLAVPPSPISRLDLVIHASVFGLWTLLFFKSAWIGTEECPIRRIVWTGVIAIVFSAFDELTQPIFSRTFDLWDLGADFAGVVIMCVLLVVYQSMKQSDQKTRSEGS